MPAIYVQFSRCSQRVERCQALNVYMDDDLEHYRIYCAYFCRECRLRRSDDKTMNSKAIV